MSIYELLIKTGQFRNEAITQNDFETFTNAFLVGQNRIKIHRQLKKDLFYGQTPIFGRGVIRVSRLLLYITRGPSNFSPRYHVLPRFQKKSRSTLTTN